MDQQHSSLRARDTVLQRFLRLILVILQHPGWAALVLVLLGLIGFGGYVGISCLMAEGHVSDAQDCMVDAASG